MGAQFTLGRLAEALGATLEGDPAQVVRGVSPFDGAGPDRVAGLIHPRDARAAGESAAGAMVVGRDVERLPVGETPRNWEAETLLPELFGNVRTLEKRFRKLEGRQHA